MSDSNAIRAGKAYVEISTLDKMSSGLKSVENKFRRWGATMTAAGKKVFLAGAALKAPLLLAAKTYATLGAEMVHSAEKANVTVEAMSALKYAAEQNGVSVEDLEKSLGKMSKAIVAAAKGSPAARDAFDQLGLSVEDLTKMTPEQKLGAIGDALARIKNPDLKRSLVESIFGKGGAAAIPLLAQGTAGITKLTTRARQLGVVMRTEDATAALKFDQSLKDLSDVGQMAMFTLGGALAPALSATTEKLIGGIGAAVRWVQTHRELAGTALKVATWVTAAGAGLIAAGYGLKIASVGLGALRVGLTAVKFLGVALSAIPAIISGIGTVVGAIASPVGVVVAVVALLVAAIGYLLYKTGLLKKGFDALTGAMHRLFDGTRVGNAARAVWDKIVDEYKSGAGKVKSIVADLTGKSAPAAAAAAAAPPSKGPDRKSIEDAYRARARAQLYRDRQEYAQLNLQDLNPNGGSGDENWVIRQKRMAHLRERMSRDSDIAEFGTQERGRLERERYNDKEGTRRRLARERAEYLKPYRDKVAYLKAALPEVSPALGTGKGSAYANRAAIIGKAERELSGQSSLFDQYENRTRQAAAARRAAQDAYAKSHVDRELGIGVDKLASHSHGILQQVRDAHATAAKKTAFDPDAAADGLDSVMKRTAGGTFNKSALFGLGGGGAVDKIAANTRKQNDLAQQGLDVAKQIFNAFKGGGLTFG